jgi:Raf kinase inhibitor-like YbhB/YbcL family protein
MFSLTSPSFEPDHELPIRFTSDGADVSPPLEWSDPPPGTKAFALIVDDPDAPDPRAPKRTWVHWVVYGLPATARRIPEAASKDAFPNGAAFGVNDWKETKWRGPAPPVGKHRYFFKLFALDEPLDELAEGASKGDLESAMMGHVLGTATLIGTYRKRH